MCGSLLLLPKTHIVVIVIFVIVVMVRSTAFVFTWNNPESAVEEFLRELSGVKYLVAGREVAPSTGTRHLQGTLVFKNARTLKSVLKKLKGAHVEVCKDVEASILYCKKGGDFFEEGSYVSRRQNALSLVEKRKQQNLAIIEARQTQSFEEMCAQGLISLYSVVGLKKTFQVFEHERAQPKCLDVLDNEWFWGPTGTGKSRTAFDSYPGAYRKPLNKWWDHYQFEETVIIDEWSPKQDKTIQSLKTWTDHYPFIAEIKGDSKLIRPKKIIVTSNYSMEECFPNPEDLYPLKRRFKVTHFNVPLMSVLEVQTQVSVPTLSVPVIGIDWNKYKPRTDTCL